jgi:FKBP-type peptidyl-prolyl cis-trans isomerase
MFLLAQKYHKIIIMKNGILVVVFVVVAAGLIGWGAWYANQLTQSSQAGVATNNNGAVDTTTGQGSSTQQTSTSTNNMDGLIIKDTVVGTGTVAEAGDTVTVNYTGTLDNGTVFDSSLKAGRTPFSFTIGTNPPQVIQGWDQGLRGMKVGGTRELTIPPALGYGSSGAGSVIPPNATLHFTIELLSVTQ